MFIRKHSGTQTSQNDLSGRGRRGGGTGAPGAGGGGGGVGEGRVAYLMVTAAAIADDVNPRQSKADVGRLGGEQLFACLHTNCAVVCKAQRAVSEGACLPSCQILQACRQLIHIHSITTLPGRKVSGLPTWHSPVTPPHQIRHAPERLMPFTLQQVVSC